MITNNTELIFWDCRAIVNMKSGEDYVTLSLTELKEDKTKSSENDTKLIESSVAEVYLGSDEIKSLIKALENMLINEETS